MIISRWNETVDHDDEVWVLGDYAMGDRNRGLGYLSRMNGTQYMVTGNHDRCSPEDSWLTDNVVRHLPDQKEWKPRSLIAHELFYFLTEDNQRPELWGWFASWDHTCLAKLFGGIPSPDWLPDFTHDLRAVLDYVNLPRSVYRRLPIWVVNHSAIADAWKTKETYDVVAQHAPFLKENGKL